MMKAIKKLVVVSVWSLLTVGVGVPAFAQAQTTDVPKVELGAGYQYLRVEGENLKEGWFTDVAFNATNNLGVVGQLSGSHRSLSDWAPAAGITLTIDGSLSVIQFLGGLRVSSRAKKGIVPFGQVLAGGVRLGASATSSVGSRSESFSEYDTELGVQVGGGFNIPAGKRLLIRVAGDYLRVLHKDEDATNFIRVTAGVVIPFGKR